MMKKVLRCPTTLKVNADVDRMVRNILQFTRSPMTPLRKIIASVDGFASCVNQYKSVLVSISLLLPAEDDDDDDDDTEELM